MTAHWPPDKIADVLSSAFCPASSTSKTQPSKSSSSDAPLTSIDVLITFDSSGISSHPNHVSLYQGAKAWLSSLMVGKSAWRAPVAVYTLRTTNILRKYLSILDVPTTLFTESLRNSWTNPKKKGAEPPSLLFINNFTEWRAGQTAMVKGHKSQMRWFRWGWVGVGRYMIVNDLKREAVT